MKNTDEMLVEPLTNEELELYSDFMDTIRAKNCENSYQEIEEYFRKCVYTAWVMMNSDNDVVSEEHNHPEEVISEMRERGYTLDDMREMGLSCNKLLCDENCWIECLDEYEY